MSQINYKLYVDMEGVRPFLYGEYTIPQQVARAKKEILRDAHGDVAFVVYRKNGMGEWCEWCAV